MTMKIKSLYLELINTDIIVMDMEDVVIVAVF